MSITICRCSFNQTVKSIRASNTQDVPTKGANMNEATRRHEAEIRVFWQAALNAFCIEVSRITNSMFTHSDMCGLIPRCLGAVPEYTCLLCTGYRAIHHCTWHQWVEI